MPWGCRQKGSKWECYNKESGKVMGKHDSKPKCEAQVRALYANYKEE